ncbi:MAG TPA: 16S rRNA (adenine(1518)-N(6)/adenine(1519)-N(6))-dimethyltransferase RsmA [Candidatus Paceibacterota bacterium]|nr:16S rRNA (adenine(1518)-N(6)/adenine(1519)-N(6))-dimethyltransferase RsmA [Candidatus Paceibacterota bacterium]
MNFASSKTIKTVLQKHTIKPSRGLGQNFLVEDHIVQKMVVAASIQPQDTVLEVGPGIGTLTQELAKHAKKVVAVEKDAKMVEILKGTLAEFKNVEVIHGDALKTQVPKQTYKVVANLPYYISAPTIRKFLEAENRPQSITLIIQKEVAQRICAKPPDMSILAVSVQFYATPKIISYIKKTSFWPQPHVDSAIIHIVPRKEKPDIDAQKFFSVVKAGFTHPRKQLLGNLSAGLKRPREHMETILRKNSIDPARRAETLSVQDWINLANDL